MEKMECVILYEITFGWTSLYINLRRLLGWTSFFDPQLSFNHFLNVLCILLASCWVKLPRTLTLSVSIVSKRKALVSFKAEILLKF